MERFASTPKDKLAADDRFPFALERKEAGRVLLSMKPGRPAAVSTTKPRSIRPRGFGS